MKRANVHCIGKIVLGIVGFALAGCQSASRPQAAGASAAASPRFASDGPNAEEYGARLGYPFAAINRPRFFVGSFSHQDQLLEGRLIRRADTLSRLARAPVEPTLFYRYDGQNRTLDDYLARNPTTGLLIARGDTILVERYQYARNDSHRFTSASMAKTVTAMLIGIAMSEGRIRSVDDLAAAYVPALAGTEYGRTSLRHLLQMSSGVRFEETYSGADDSARLWIETVHQAGTGGAAAVKPFNQRGRWGGAVFSYASAETQVLGLVLANAVGQPVAEYLRDKIWQPMGAEADATWIIDAAGQEATYCCLNAVLRDYARLGACRALGRARVGPALGRRLGAKRSRAGRHGEHLQRRMRPKAGPTRRAGAICGAIRRCRLLVWLGHMRRRRLVWRRNSPRRGPDPKPDRLLGLLLAHDGRIGDKQIIPKAWVLEATTVPADRPDLSLVWPDTQFGYGYQTWLFNGERRMFALLGVHGQAIYVDPTSRLVLVHTAVRKQATDPNKETLALWRGIVDGLGGQPR